MVWCSLVYITCIYSCIKGPVIHWNVTTICSMPKKRKLTINNISPYGYETNHLRAHVSTEGSCSTVVLHLKKILLLVVVFS